MRTQIRNLGGILTGDLAAPRSDEAEIEIEDGRIVAMGAAPGERSGADQVIDAGGAWAAPGLWDGAAALYFGDHDPQFSARGAIAAAVEFGTTSLVIGGRVAVPGWIGTPRTNRELAVLTIKSWRFDRPLGIKVVAGVIDGDPAWTAEDLADLASAGASTLMISAGADSAIRLGDAAREAGLRVGALVATRSAGTDAATIDAIAELRPDVVMLRASSDIAVRELLDGTTASIGVALTAGIGPATQLVCGAADRTELARVFLGSGLPGRAGVLPGAMPLFLDALAGTTGLAAEQLVALASSHAARAFGLAGGVLAPGQAADLALLDPGRGSVISWAQPVRMTFIDGNPVWSREAGR